jgi:Secretion system C-terminal sorting domain/Receptor L domain
MKWLLFLSLLTSSAHVFAQSCLPNGIVLSRQGQIDSFAINYPGCTVIQGDLCIGLCTGQYQYSQFTNLNGLSQITEVQGDLNISWNPRLAGLSGLDNLTSVGGSVRIGYNDSLPGFTALANLVSISGDFDPSNLPMINNFAGLNNLLSIGGDFTVTNVDKLASFSGLDSLSYIRGDCIIYCWWSFDLKNLSGLDNLSSIGGDLFIDRSPRLSSLTGLEGLTTVGGNLRIENQDTLGHLSGLNNIDSIGGDLMIRRNSFLTDLSALDNLKSINGEIQIFANDLLASLQGIQNIDANSIAEVDITNNPLLSYCAVKSICDFLPTAWLPNANFRNNATGCNSKTEVEAACSTVGLNDVPINQRDISIYPNPTTGTIILTVEHEGVYELELINLNGKVIDYSIKSASGSQLKYEIDSKVAPGMYFISVTDESGERINKRVVFH